METPHNHKATVNYFFEVGALAKTPRSFPQLLGSGEQSVGEHMLRVAHIGFVLAKLEDEPVDIAAVLQMSIFHDIAESRISDLNYVNQKYVDRHEDRAVEELAATIDFGEDVRQIIHRYEERTSREAIIVKDADNLEFILSLKEQVDIGNTRAETWIPSAVKRLKTDNAKALAEIILTTNSDEWWFGDKNDSWWVSRNKEKIQETNNELTR